LERRLASAKSQSNIFQIHITLLSRAFSASSAGFSCESHVLIGVLVMFNNAWVGYVCSSLVECLIVFALLFLAGVLWSWGLRCYVAHRLKDDVDE